MSIKDLKDLPLLKSFDTPITAATREFYLDTLANGSGPNGLVLIQDFFGASTGPEAAASIQSAASIIRRQLANGTLANLAAIYANMAGSVTGAFGDPTTGPISIPSGPGSGSYSDANDALGNLVSLAQSAISSAAAAMGGDTAALNAAFSEPAGATVSEQDFQTAAGIDFADLTEGALTPVLALITSVPTLGTSDASGRPSQFFESVLDKTSVAGQALIGAMREGQNSLELNQVGINQYSTIPGR